MEPQISSHAHVYLQTDILELRLDFLHQTHVPAVDKVLSAPLLQQPRPTGSQTQLNRGTAGPLVFLTLLPLTFLNAL